MIDVWFNVWNGITIKFSLYIVWNIKKIIVHFYSYFKYDYSKQNVVGKTISHQKINLKWEMSRYVKTSKLEQLSLYVYYVNRNLIQLFA